MYGHHASVCAVKGDRIKRHNLIRDIIFDFCYAAAWFPSKEKPHLLPHTSERPADAFVPNYSCGKDLVLDVAVTCPLQHKYLHAASVTAGVACNEYAVHIKLKNFQDRVEQEGFISYYLPFILETFAGYSNDVAEPDLTNQNLLLKKNVNETISCVLMKSLARAVSLRFVKFCH